MKAIGGYFGLELHDGFEYHADAIRLNTGRNALEYILIAKKYKKIYLPYFTCKVLLEPIKNNCISYEYYCINENFEADFNFDNLKEEECFLYTNYFGFKEEYILSLTKKCNNLIIDNAQAFYAKPVQGITTFYSPRKFFGVPDGAYLYTDIKMETPLKKDYSSQRFEHLLERIDKSAEVGYSKFVENDDSLSDLPLMEMSNITQKMLQSIDYNHIAVKRCENFKFLSKHLKGINKIDFELNENHIPMVYPFFSDDISLRKKLMVNKIYTGQYWKEVQNLVQMNSVEYQFANHLVHLPVDQRYNEIDLKRIVDLLM
ncbi:hypothetical protein [Flavobacterium sp. LB3P21]|uniref:hypothetical protein n=1 Tax=unclassified Flavobacterium TaxID=196869 RepID=UPI003AAE5207